jgi:hypothetical protein
MLSGSRCSIKNEIIKPAGKDVRIFVEYILE